MKKNLLILLAMVLVVSSVMAGGQQESSAASDGGDKTVTLVYAEVNNLETIAGKTGVKFKEEVERLSGGTVLIDIQHSGVLGAEHDVLDAMLGGGGTIDMSRISAFALTSYGGVKSSLLSIPYTFAGRDHFWNFAESDLASEFLLEPVDLDLGIRGLFYAEEGFRHFFGSKPLNSIADMKGLKVRISTDPIAQGMVTGVGADPTQVSYSELYSALQSGVVDAAEQPIANYFGMAFHEVAPYMILDGHTLGAMQVIMTDEAWNKLSAAQQDAIMEAGKLASAYNRSLSEGAEKEVLKKLAAAGASVVPVKDVTPWQKACAETIEKASAVDPALYQKILDLQ